MILKGFFKCSAVILLILFVSLPVYSEEQNSVLESLDTEKAAKALDNKAKEITGTIEDALEQISGDLEKAGDDLSQQLQSAGNQINSDLQTAGDELDKSIKTAGTQISGVLNDFFLR